MKMLATLCLALTAASTAGAQTFFGLPHTPLGTAQLSLEPDGRLKVSNLGSSGKDGVSINPGDGQGFEATVELGPGVLPLDPRLILKTYFETGDIPTENQFSNLIDSLVSDEYGIGFETVGFSPECVRVSILDGGVEVASAEFVAPYPQYLVVSNIGSSGKDGVRYSAGMGTGTGLPSLHAELQFSAPVSMTITGVTSASGDTIRMTLDGLPTGEPIRRAFEITGSDLGIVHLHAEGIVHRDIAARSVGASNLGGTGTARNGQLVVSNIGSSGKDGVRFIAPPFGTTDIMRWELDAAPLGAGQQIVTESTLNGAPAGTFGVVGGDAVGLPQLFADFSPIGGQTLILQVFDAGTFSGCTVVQGGGVIADIQTDTVEVTVLDLASEPTDDPTCGSSNGNRTLIHGLQFSAPVTIRPPGELPLVGDHVRVVHISLTDPGPVPVDFVVRTNLPQLQFGDIDVTSSTDPVSSSGLPHLALGAAQLSNSGGTLRVSNLGSSGKDGVTIDLGEAEGWEGTIDFGPAGGLDPQLELQVEANDRPVCIRGSGGGRAEVCIPAGFDYGPVTVDLFRAGAPVHTQVFSAPYPALVVGNIGSSGKDGVRCGLEIVEDATGPVQIVRLIPPTTTSLTVGSFTALCDRVRLSYKRFDCRIRCTQVRAAHGNGGSITIADQTMGLFGATTTSEGNANRRTEICDGRDHLVVSNIGSSGKDGVRMGVIDPDDDGDSIPTRGFSTDLKATRGDVNVEKFEFRQEFGQQQGGQRISSVESSGQGGGRAITIGASPWMTLPEVTLDLLQGDTVVFSGPMPPPPGVVATTQSITQPGSYAFDLRGLGGGTGSGLGFVHQLAWTTLQNVTVSNGPTVTADGIRIRVDEGAVPLGGSVSSELGGVVILCATSASGSDLDITNAAFDFIDTCPTDLDGDGITGFTDLVAVLSVWGPCADGAEDLDGNGDVGFTDLVAVLSAWGPCP